MSITMAAGSLFDGAIVGLRALEASTRSMPARLFRALLWVVLSVDGPLVDGAAGSVWGTAAANCLVTDHVWCQLRLATRELDPQPRAA